MIIIPEAIQHIQAFPPGTDGSAAKSQELILQMLRHTETPLSRAQYAPGHLTCTGLVLAPEADAVLMVHHARLERWLLPGGHVEAEDADIYAAARREVIEETSVALDDDVAPFIAGMDVHGIPPKRGEPFHLHHDLIIAFQARFRQIARSDESLEVRWVELSRLDDFQTPLSIANSIQRTLLRRRS